MIISKSQQAAAAPAVDSRGCTPPQVLTAPCVIRAAGAFYRVYIYLPRGVIRRVLQSGICATGARCEKYGEVIKWIDGDVFTCRMTSSNSVVRELNVLLQNLVRDNINIKKCLYKYFTFCFLIQLIKVTAFHSKYILIY